MRALQIRKNQVDYVGLLAQPAFSLWGEGKLLMAALFGAYRHEGVTLADITTTDEIVTAADPGVSVRLASGTTFRFRFDRVEARLLNYDEAELETFPEIVNRGVNSMREAASDFAIASHLLSHASHSVIVGVPSRDFFSGLAAQPNLGVGRSRGHGFIFHAEIPESGWQISLTLDHSISIPDGIFLGYNVLIAGDRLDYKAVMKESRDVLAKCLAAVGLTIQKSDA